MKRSNSGIPGIFGLLGRLANIGLFVAAALLVGLFLGTTVDSMLGSAPVGALLGLAFGAVAGLREFVRIYTSLTQDTAPPPSVDRRSEAEGGPKSENETESEGRNPEF